MLEANAHCIAAQGRPSTRDCASRRICTYTINTRLLYKLSNVYQQTLDYCIHTYIVYSLRLFNVRTHYKCKMYTLVELLLNYAIAM